MPTPRQTAKVRTPKTADARSQGTRSTTGSGDRSGRHADLARIDEILPGGGFGARYVDSMLPSWT